MEDINRDCKAIFLTVHDSLDEKITSKDEFLTLLQQVGRNPSRKALAQFWSDRTTSLSFYDYVNAAQQIGGISEEDLIRVFKKLDKNGDGYIDLKELQQLLTSKGDKMTEAEAAKLIKDVDDNGDGKLDYREFCKSMQSTANECKRLARNMLEERERNSKKAAVVPTPKSDPPPAAKVQPPAVSAPPPVPPRDELGDDDDDDIVVSTRGPTKAGTKQLDFAKLPPDVDSWQQLVSRRGYFLYDDGAEGQTQTGGPLLCHTYSLNVTKSGDYVIAIEPLPLKLFNELIKDLMLLVLTDEREPQLVAFSCARDKLGRNCARVTLKPGRYSVVPLTSGLRFQRRTAASKTEAKLLKADKDDKNKFVATVHFRDALTDMFTMSDLDGNGTLNRQEFSLYMQRTDGQIVSDEDWKVLADMVDIKKLKGEVTLDGFITLNVMEIEENEYDLSDTWVTLTSMGFSRNLTLERALPFVVTVLSSANVQASLDPRSPDEYIKVQQKLLPSCLVNAALMYGTPAKAQNGQPDLVLYQLVLEQRALLAVDNKSGQNLRLDVDCSSSKNALCGLTQNGTCSSRGRLSFQVDAKPRTSALVAHAVVDDDKKDLAFDCSYSLR